MHCSPAKSTPGTCVPVCRYEYLALTSDEKQHGRAVASRRVEPTQDGEKRRRIAALLLQRANEAKEGGAAGGQKS